MRFLRWGIGVFGALFLAGCATDSGTQPSRPGGEDVVRVGVLLPFSGECGSFGPAALKAIEVATDEINAAGGVLGRMIELVVRDTRTDPFWASLAATELVEDEGVFAILGGDASDVAEAVLEVAAEHGTFLISGAASSVELSSPDVDVYSAFFRTVPTTAHEGQVMAMQALRMGDSTAKIIYVDDSYGRTLMEQFTTRFESRGGVVERAVPFEVGKASYAQELESLFCAESVAAQSEPLVVLIAYPISGATIVRDWRASGFGAKWLLCDALKSEEFVLSAGAENVEGMYGISPYYGSDNYANYDRFSEAFEDMWGEDPALHRCTEHWYDAMILLAYAILRADTLDPAAVKDSLQAVSAGGDSVVYVGEFERGKRILEAGEDINYEGASGSVNFDASGDVVGTFELWRIEEGEIVSQGDVNP